MVIFSPELFAIQNFGGITRCMIALMRALSVEQYDWQVWAGQHGSEPLLELQNHSAYADRITGQYQGRLPGRLASTFTHEWGFRQYLAGHDKALIHRSQYTAIDMVPGRFRQISTAHDMWTEHPHASLSERARSYFKLKALDRSDAIVAISDHTRMMLIERCPHLEGRVTTIHHGVAPISTAPVAVPPGRPFFLYVGAREARKNFPIILHALAAAQALADADIVCVGGGAFADAEQQLIATLGLAGRVHQRPANDDILAGLYEKALALLYPSTFEGFGLPLLEAMQHNCPVICAPVSCMPEICADAALYAAPHNAEEWAAMMESIAQDTQTRQTMIARGNARTPQFSWARSAQKHIALYRGLT